jgi:flagellar assembly protein FliH
MTKPLKFTFETVFSPHGAETDETPEEITFTEDEMEAARTAAREEGFAAGMDRARDMAEQQIALSLEQLLGQTGQLQQAMAEEFDTSRAEAGRLALEISGKLAPALVARQPLAETEALMSDCLSHLNAPPFLSVHIAPELADDLRQRLDHFTEQHGYGGTIKVLEGTGMTPGDCRISWNNGSVQRNSAGISAKIEAAINRYINALAGPEHSGGDSE